VYAYANGNPISYRDPSGWQSIGNAFALSFNFQNVQAMQQTATASYAYSQDPAWQQAGPNPVIACSDIGCVNANNYLLSWLEVGLWALAGEAAPVAAGGMCRIATPTNVRGMLTAIPLFNIHGAPDVFDQLQLAQQSEEMAAQYVLPGGILNR
jgi:hypothetical protein